MLYFYFTIYDLHIIVSPNFLCYRYSYRILCPAIKLQKSGVLDKLDIYVSQKAIYKEWLSHIEIAAYTVGTVVHSASSQIHIELKIIALTP